MLASTYRRLACASLLVCVAFAAPAPAEAGVGEGDIAPDWEAKEFIHHDNVSLKSLRGRLVFIEYFGTG